jgi:acetolactate synthase-1/2/3 large subunit
VSDWLHTNRGAGELASDMAEAIAAASGHPGKVATLIVPADHQAAPASGPAGARAAAPASAVGERALGRAARALKSKKPKALLLGSGALSERGLRAAARLAAACGCALFCETFPARLERGGGLAAVEKVPYFPEQALERLAGFASLVLAGAPDPVAFFGYPGLPSCVRPPGTRRVLLARPSEDAAGALEALAERLGAPRQMPAGPRLDLPERPVGPLTIRTLGQALASVQPEGAIVVDEGNTCGPPYFSCAAGSPRFTYLSITGGAIGFGPPAATGAALARPGTRVLALQADGSALYTLQALWTQAREGLDVTTIVCSNRSYRILRVELARAGIAEPGAHAIALTDLSSPAIDWIALARGLGVPARRVEDAGDLAAEIERSLAEPGPRLIEAVVDTQ